MSVTIRHALPGDRARLIDLFQALNVYEDALTGDRRCERAGAEENLAFAEERLAERGGSFLVAEADGAVAGLLVLVHETDSVYVRAERRPYALIQELVVDESCRRLGIGGALMQAAEEIAVARGYKRLLVGVLAGNEAAEAAYARHGFRPVALDLEKAIGD